MIGKKYILYIISLVSFLFFTNGFLTPRIDPGAKEGYNASKLAYDLLHSNNKDPEYMTTIEDFDGKYFVDKIDMGSVWYYYSDVDENRDSKTKASIALDTKVKADGAASLRINFDVMNNPDAYVGVGQTFATVQDWSQSDKEIRLFIKADKPGIHFAFTFLVTDPKQQSYGERGLALFGYHYLTTEEDTKQFHELHIKFSDLKLSPKYEPYASVKHFTGKDVETMDFGFQPGEKGTVWVDGIRLKSKVDIIALNSKVVQIINPVKVNQAGYKINDKKYTIVTKDAEAFEVVKIKLADDGTEKYESMYKGDLIYKGFEPDAGDEIYVGDFSSLKIPGEYRIKVGTNYSYKFEISKSPYELPLYLVGHAIYDWRCGFPVKEPALGYINPGCHKDDAYYWEKPEVKKDETGGWHDAGDYGKYIPTAGSAVSSMMFSYEQNKTKLNKLDLKIDDHSDKRADILTEILWELKWMLRMQEPDGGVHHKVAPQNFGNTAFPWEETAKRYIFRVTSSSTAWFTGSMAVAARIYKKSDPQLAEQFKQAAIKSWSWLNKHRDQVPPGGFKDPPECEEGGEYPIDNDRGNRFYAAAAIYRLTGDSTAKDYLEKHFYEANALNHDIMWAEAYPLGLFEILNNAKADSKLIEKAKSVLADDIAQLKSAMNKNKYGVPAYGRSGKYPWIWGSHALIFGRSLYVALASKYLKDDSLLQYAKRTINYTLGVNPLGYAYITKFGEYSPEHPHHNPSFVTGHCFPGLVAEGPNGAIGDSGGDTILQNLWKNNLPPMKCYQDAPMSWATNEPTVEGNALFFALLAFFL